MSEVLIVDDEPPIRELLSRWLTAAGHAVRAAGTAEEALASLAEHSIGVALCDKLLPGPDGLWLIEQLRQRHPEIAIVLATADDAVPPRVSLQDGVVGYLVKPFKHELVLAAVADAMAWHRVAVRGVAERKASRPDVDTWLKGRAGRPDPKREP